MLLFDDYPDTFLLYFNITGDEIKAAVVDLGSSMCRFGAAGQDIPRHAFRSELGFIEGSKEKESKTIVGDFGVRCIQDGVDIVRPFNADGNFYSLI